MQLPPQLASMDFATIFKFVNLTVGTLFVLGGISQFFPISFQSVVIGVDVIIFGLGLILLEFRVPPLTYKYASFLFTFAGRGIFYAFIGTILLHDHVLRIVAGSVIGVIGLIYFAFEFIPGIERPQSMIAPEQSDYEDATNTI